MITKELLKSWNPCSAGHKRFCELFPDGADLKTAADGLSADGHDEWAIWLFDRCRERNLFTEVTSNGHRNTGHQNTGDFNTVTPQDILAFNRPVATEVWDAAYKPGFLYFSVTYWVYESKTTDAEKKADPNFYVRGGQLRKKDYKQAFKESWDAADKADRERVRSLPNFDADVFFEISGIDLRETK